MEKLMNSINFISITHFLYNSIIIVTSLATLLGLYIIYCCFILPRLSPLKDLPGPPGDSWWLGNLETLGTRHAAMYCAITEKYGGIVRLPVALGGEWLLLTDPTAASYLLATETYRPSPPTVALKLFFGPGALGCEGDDHRRQRRTLVPAFGPGQVKADYPAFLHCSYNLRDRFKQLINDEVFDPSCFKNAAAGRAYRTKEKKSEGKEIVLDAMVWGSRFAIDVIGKAGFSMDIDSIFNDDHSLFQGLDLFLQGMNAPPQTFLEMLMRGCLIYLLSWFPIYEKLPSWIPIPFFQTMLNGTKLMNEESSKFIAEKKSEIAEDGIDGLGKENDIMTVLFRANLLEGKDKLSDRELIAQLPTLFLSGSETTASSISWILHLLSENPELQTRLRLELRAARKHIEAEFGRSELTVDEMEALLYLNAVVCETLRLHPALQVVMRESSRAHSIPISKPILSKTTGKYIDHVSIAKGQHIVIPTSAMNRNKEIFGEDAHEFNPERWNRKNLGAGIGSSNHLMSFSAGKRRCPAYKFAVLELKIIISVLIDEFEFFPREKGVKVDAYNGDVTMSPSIAGEIELGGRMPLGMRIAPRVE